MTDFLSNVGVNYFVFQPIFLSPEHPLFQKLDIITSQKSKSLFIKEIRKIRNIKYNIILPSTLYTDILKTITEKNNISISNCFGGRSLFFVDPLGDIWPCPSSHRKTNQDKIGNIKNLSKQGVRQIFDSKQELNNSCKFADRDCVCMFELKSSQIWNNH
ncbi:MAG: hypothetical protein GYA14_01005 [Ignavibacteria bacterium]|nr:hypothetical protein [Ignavibacteria bacterium]